MNSKKGVQLVWFIMGLLLSKCSEHVAAVTTATVTAASVTAATVTGYEFIAAAACGMVLRFGFFCNYTA